MPDAQKPVRYRSKARRIQRYLTDDHHRKDPKLRRNASGKFPHTPFSILNTKVKGKPEACETAT